MEFKFHAPSPPSAAHKLLLILYKNLTAHFGEAFTKFISQWKV